MVPINLDINEALIILQPLLVFIVGMVIYALFIFKFYRFLARREIFKLNLDKYNKSEHPVISKTVRVIFYIIEYILFFPLFIFLWFAILTVLLMFLAKEQPVHNILIISMALVASVRITAYYKEDLSKDLAKMLPFALLGIFLIDITFFVPYESIIAFKEIPNYLNEIVYYFLFVVALEFVLRIMYSIASPFLPKEEENEN